MLSELVLAAGPTSRMAGSTAAENAGSGDSLLWPLFLLVVVVYALYQVWSWNKAAKRAAQFPPLTEEDVLAELPDYLPDALVKQHRKWAAKTVRSR